MSQLERAKKRRERDLQRITELLTSCTCEYPLRTFRNMSGHSEKCPSHAIHMKHREEDDALRSLIS
jgi:hypothetical protein